MKPAAHATRLHLPTSVLRPLILILSTATAFAVDIDPVLKGQWPRHLSGRAQDVVVSDNYAYVAAQEGGLIVVDVSNPSDPRGIAGYDSSGQAQGVAVSGNYVYLVDGDLNASRPGEGLVIIDASDPANPARVGAYKTAGAARAVTVSGDYAYVADGTNGLQVINISDPAHPQWMGGVDVGQAAVDVTLSGNHAYVACSYGPPPYTGSLQVVDITDPKHPQKVGSIDIGDGASHVVVSNHYAYVTSWGGLQVIDVQDPTQPNRVGSFSLAVGSSDVAVAGQLAYLTDPSFGLDVLDISDPTNPHQVGGYEGVNYLGVVTVQGNYAYIAGYYLGLEILSIAVPTSPEWIGSYPTFGYGESVAVSGNYAYLAYGGVGLEVLDLLDPSNPQQVGEYLGEQFSFQGTDVAISGHYAYVVGDWHTNMSVIDISDPTHPQRVGEYLGDSGFRTITVSGNYAYLGTAPDFYQAGALCLVDITDPTNPQLRGKYLLGEGDEVLSIAVSGDYVYFISSYTPLVLILNTVDPTAPVLEGHYQDFGGTISSLWISGDYLYVGGGAGLKVLDIHDPINLVPVASPNMRSVGGMNAGGDLLCTVGDNGLGLLEISDPAAPRRLGSCRTFGDASDVAVVGDYAYVANGSAGFLVVELKQAANPQRVSTYETVADCVAISGNYAFLPDGNDGLQVIDMSDRANPVLVGGIQTTSRVNDIVVSGDFAYVANDVAGLLVVNIADPANPEQVGEYQTIGRAVSVAISDHYVYVADGDVDQGYLGEKPGEGLVVVDVSDPSHPQKVGGYDTSASAYAVAVSGGYAYVVDESLSTGPAGEGMVIIDTTDLASPQRVGAFDPTGRSSSVAVSGDYAFVVGDTLEVLDIHDPFNPHHIESSAPGGWLTGIALLGNHAYVADAFYGLHVIDITDPAAPQRVGGNGAFDGYGVAVNQNGIYVAAHRDGLVILDPYQAPAAPMIVWQPLSRTNVVGSSLMLSVIAEASGSLSYQWLKEGEPLTGATNRTHVLAFVQTDDAGTYQVRVTDSGAVALSSNAVVTIVPAVPPSILAGPITNLTNSHEYYLLNQSTWVEAEAAAQAMGGHLVTVNNQAEQDWIIGQFGNWGEQQRLLWIGLHDADPVNNATNAIDRRAEFVWADGEPVSYDNWNAVEPNNYRERGEYYVHTLSPTDPTEPGGWVDAWDVNFNGGPLHGVVEVAPRVSVILYVDTASASPNPPYATWETAAHTIQDAVDAAQAGDTVLVTNGLYASGGRAVVGTMTNRVAVDKPLTVQSVNGPEYTMIKGYQVPNSIESGGIGAVRCVYLAAGASLSGFTLTNGATQVPSYGVFELQGGGGLWCESESAWASNCVLSGNWAISGGGSYQGTLTNCTLMGNSAFIEGGGAFQAMLANCVLSHNEADSGGGAYGSKLYNCLLDENSASMRGGGASECDLYSCTLTNNYSELGGGASGGTLVGCIVAGNYAGGGGGGVDDAILLRDCLVTRNAAPWTGGVSAGTLYNCVVSFNHANDSSVGGVNGGTLYNCTVVSNRAERSYGGGSGVFYNSIVYYNLTGWPEPDVTGTMSNCCIAPNRNFPAPEGNITNEPAFVDWENGDFHLLSSSPCIDAGTNLSGIVTNDLDGLSRPLDGNGDGIAAFDMGAYEFDLRTIVPVNWFAGYGLDSTDPNVVAGNPDHDAFTTYQEWVADTDPTDPDSFFHIEEVSASSPIHVYFQSSSHRLYTLLWATNPTQTTWTDIPGQMDVPGTGQLDSLTDSTHGWQKFYRLSVRLP